MTLLVSTSFTPGLHPRPSGVQRQGRPISRAQVCRAQADDESKAPASKSILSALCPLLKVFAGSDPTEPRNRNLEVALSGFASIARLPFGVKAGEVSKARSAEPKQLLKVYAFEACPFCRRVAEAVTDLDLEVEYYPCPKDALRNRDAVLGMGGKAMFPFLVDPNTGTAMYESGDIVEYLYREYGGGAEPPSYLLPSTLVSGWVPTLLRAGRGMTRYEGATTEAPQEMLELYNYDGNQFARLVREALTELELPYVVRSCGKGSPRREKLREVSGATQVPYLVDNNTGAKVSDSDKILEYLFDTYCVKA